jgi:hypothetical protein
MAEVLLLSAHFCGFKRIDTAGEERVQSGMLMMLRMSSDGLTEQKSSST